MIAVSGEVFDGVHVEPTDDSMTKAVEYARAQGTWDGFVAVGGGSAIDTAKAINLLTTHPGELMDYVNKPIGGAKTPPGPLKPLVAVPTTAGTGSESTAMCILDILSMKVKTGISHWRLRPTLAVVDPLLTMSLPPEVTAASGMDIVCHAVESYTARWYATFEAKKPEQRVTYCGANPVSDLWCEKAMSLIARSFRTAVHQGADDVGGADGHDDGGDLRRHGVRQRRRAHPARERLSDRRDGARTTGRRATRRTNRWSARAGGVADGAGDVPVHLRRGSRAAPAGGRTARPAGRQGERPAEQLPSVLVGLMRDIGIPNGIGGVGYTEADVADLVPGTMKQQRLLATCAKTPTEDDIAAILTRSVQNW